MKKRALVTMGDAAFEPITSITFPRAEEYAVGIGADFLILEGRTYPKSNICWEKLRLASVLERYERVLYLDGDVLVRRTAPNVFDEVPNETFGAMDEIRNLVFWKRGQVEKQLAPHGWEGPWNGVYFNAGVMVLGQGHREPLFERPRIVEAPYWDQDHFNARVAMSGVAYHSLSPKYNYLLFHTHRNPEDSPEQAHFIHFSGTRMTPEEKREEMLIRLKGWT